jgi:hypothetical protein
MRLQDAVGMTFRGIGAKVRRDAIAYLICAVCALTAFALATWASVLALVPAVGAVYALLIVAGVFVLIVAATMLWLQYVKSHPRVTQGAPFAALNAQADVSSTQRQMQFAQLAMIIEAVLLGYSMSRRR